MEEDFVAVQHLHDEQGELRGLLITRHHLRPDNASRFEFSFVINGDLECTHYSFDYRSEDGGLIWRKDKDPHHAGIGPHIHRGHEDSREPYEEVDTLP